MILNNLFLFILPDFCTKVFSPYLNSTHTRNPIDRFEMGKKCPLLNCTVLCMFWHFSFSTTRGKQRSMRLSMDISSKMLVSVFFLFSSVDRHWMWKKRKTHLDAIFYGWWDKKGKKRFVYSWVPVGSLFLRSEAH
jgi:hypothetical protein